MLNGLLARKIGMTQIFEEDGTALPVTVLQSGTMTVVQKRSRKKTVAIMYKLGLKKYMSVK